MSVLQRWQWRILPEMLRFKGGEMIIEFISEMLPLIQSKKLQRADQNLIENDKEYAISIYQVASTIRIDIKPTFFEGAK